MRKLILLASVLLIAVPFLADAGRFLGWWNLVNGFDIFAHSSVSIGLAILVSVLLRNVGVIPTYLNIIIPVVLIGVLWEFGELVLSHAWYVSHYDMVKDVAVDVTRALIGATAFNEISPH